jgi:hypothetical protein
MGKYKASLFAGGLNDAQGSARRILTGKGSEKMFIER